MVGPELLFLICKSCFLAFFARGSLAKWLRSELTIAQRGSVNGAAGLKVAPPSVFHGHHFIEVRNRSRRVGIRLLQTGKAG